MTKKTKGKLFLTEIELENLKRDVMVLNSVKINHVQKEDDILVVSIAFDSISEIFALGQMNKWK